jgi:hypothetical protein
VTSEATSEAKSASITEDAAMTEEKPKRTRRSQLDLWYAEYRAEEDAWKAEQERERIARGDPPKPRPVSFVATLRHTEVDRWGQPWTPRRPRRDAN